MDLLGLVPALVPLAMRSLLGAEPAAEPLVLTIGPRFRTGATTVAFQLGGDGDPGQTEGLLQLPYAAFGDAPAMGSGRSRSRLPALRVPEDVAIWLSVRIGQLGAPRGQPLWLKLRRPYGILGTVPWEAALCPALDRPVLRLPDYPDRPIERPDVLEGALIVDAAADADVADVARRATEVAMAVLRASSRSSTHLHVFAEARLHRALAALKQNPQITVYDPPGDPLAAQGGKTYSVQLQSQAWVDWVLDKIGNRCLDALHLVVRARWGESGANLLVSASPSATGRAEVLAPIDLEEVRLIANRVGAWAVTFTPPSGSLLNDVAFAADSFAHLRPGAVLFNPGGGLRDLARLHEACRLLFSTRESPVVPSDGGFVYCHPDFATGQTPTPSSTAGWIEQSARLLLDRAPVAERLSRAVTRWLPGVATTELSAQPGWVAALQRYAEDAAMQALRRTGGDVLLSNARPDTGKLSSEATSTLTGIQEVLRSYLAGRKEL